MTATAAAVDVNFDVFPGPDGVVGTGDDIVVNAGDEITDQYMGAGLIIENAVASTGEPGLFAIPQGPPGSETDDILPTTGQLAVAPMDIPDDLTTSSTGFINFRFFPSATGFALDFLDVEGSGTPGTGNTYIDITLSNGAVEHVPVPSGPNANQVTIGYTAPAGVEVINAWVSLNYPIMMGESGAVDSLAFARAEGCWLTSGGWLAGTVNRGRKQRHSFGGNVGPPPSGAWEHQDHGQGLNFHSNDAHIVDCHHDGGDGPGKPRAANNVALFEGTGRLNNVDGYAFSAMVIDRGEPGKRDHYAIQVWEIGEPGDLEIDVDSRLSGGNIQIHPPNPSLN